MQRLSETSLWIVTPPVLVQCSEEEAQGTSLAPIERVRVVTKKELRSLAEQIHQKRQADESKEAFVQRVGSLQMIPYINTLKKATEKRDKLAVAKAFEFMGRTQTDPGIEPSWELWELTLANITSVLLASARLVFWFEEKTGRIGPAVLCPDVNTAIAAAWLLNGNLRVCPHCQKIFVGKTFYCGFECGEAHRQAKFRGKKSAKKGGR